MFQVPLFLKQFQQNHLKNENWSIYLEVICYSATVFPEKLEKLKDVSFSKQIGKSVGPTLWIRRSALEPPQRASQRLRFI